MPTCGACAKAKAKQKSLPSRVEISTKVVQVKEEVKTINKRMHSDISTIKAPAGICTTVTKPQWVILVDVKTGMKWTKFHEHKNDMVEPMCAKFHKWKEAGMPVKVIRCYNIGENLLLQKRANSAAWKINIKFEYTARDTPQQNSLAEVGLVTLSNRGRAMMIAVNVPMEEGYKLFWEAFTCATMLDWLAVIVIDTKVATRVEHWCGMLPSWAKSLRVWGEVGLVNIKTKTTPKLYNKCITCMYVGYALNHVDGVYRIWNPNST
eukprot:13938327-Ditylum_brightwellii.AAC.2